MLKKISHNPQAVVGLILIILMLSAALLAPVIAPNNPEQVNTADKFVAASAEYPLGTDQLGRCILSRLIYGARYSLGMALPALLILAVIGLALGTVSAYAGGVLDRVFIMLCDIFIAFPALVVAVAIVGAVGNGTQNITLAIVVSMWAWFTRVVRSYAVMEMGRDYILSARIAGCGGARIILRHLIPNILPQFLVYFSTGVASAILTLSSFSFLGLGLVSGTPEWGAMLNEARSCLYTHPELLIYPGVCIAVTAAGFNLFGEALRDILEPGEGI